MFKHVFTRAMILISVALIPFGGQAGLFKWVDENGKTHYSDKDPNANSKSKAATKVEQPKKFGNKSSNTGKNPISLPQGAASKELLLLETRYLWSRASETNKTTKVGVFHTGTGCTTRGAITMPKAIKNNKRLFPEGRELTNDAYSVITKLNYPISRTEKLEIFPGRKKRHLTLQGEIVDMDFNTCALGVSRFDSYGDAVRIPGWEFTKHRLKLQVNWVLRSAQDKKIVYQTISSGSYNGWQEKHLPQAVFGKAFKSATLALFSDPKFIEIILQS